MSNFFSRIEASQAIALDGLSRLAFQAREARAGLLRFHGVEDESGLRARILDGRLAEHPAWEHYVGARVLTVTRESARAAMAKLGRSDDALPHLRIRDALEAGFAARLAAPVEVRLDALEVMLQCGVRLAMRFASADEYVIEWHDGDDSCRAMIDTAPCHPGLAGAPSHLHRADGRVVADTVTHAGADPVENACAIVTMLVANPRFALED